MMLRSLVVTAYILTSAVFVLYTVGSVHGWRHDGPWLHTHEPGAAHYRWRGPTGRMEVWAHGDVTFRPDDTGVERISPGGSLTIEQQRGLTTRRLDARPAPNGSVVYSYSVNGDPQRFDATAQRAFAGLLPTVIRQTGIGAKVRIARILNREGVDGVFAEIDRIERSSASARYLQELLEQGNLETVQLARLADEIGEQLSSSAAKSRLLTSAVPYVQAVPTDDPNADATRSAYFEAIDSISSSADRARVLRQVLDADHLETATLTRVARSAEGISSSSHKAGVLSGMTAHYTNDPQLRDAFFDAAESISSSSHRSRVLIALLDADSADKTSLAALLEAARSISSSGDKTKVLVAAAGHLSGDANLVSAYTQVARSLSSSGNRERAFAALGGS